MTVDDVWTIFGLSVLMTWQVIIFSKIKSGLRKCKLTVDCKFWAEESGDMWTGYGSVDGIEISTTSLHDTPELAKKAVIDWLGRLEWTKDG